MSANGLPSNSSEVAIRFMSAIERASRKASTNRFDVRFRPEKVRLFTIRVVQEMIEAHNSPIITHLTTQSASMNMVTGPMVAPCLIEVGGFPGLAAGV